MSSKGQVVIPASVRRELGLRSGQVLRVRKGVGKEIVLTAVEDDSVIQQMLERARAWEPDRDLVAELHERRQREREHAKRRRY